MHELFYDCSCARDSPIILALRLQVAHSETFSESSSQSMILMP